MKKTILIVAASLFTLAASAQKPVAGDVTGEVQLNFQTGTEKVGIVSPVLKGRYFLQDKMAIRARLGITNSKVTQDYTALIDGEADGSSEVKNSSFTIAAGIEKHFTGTGRLSPYVGAELAFTSTSSSTDETNYDSDIDSWVNDYAWSVEQKGSAFGINLVAGADYYFTDRVYLGIEVAWGFVSSNAGDEEWTMTSSGSTTSGTDPGAKTSGLNITPNSGLRLGLCF